MTRISIAMATYNGEHFIQQQLDSFAAQSRLPDELVICDDGSSDRTVAIAETFAATAPFSVKIYQNDTNLGFSENFQRAISLSDGDIVFISDQDDVWYPQKIEVVRRCIESDETIHVAYHDQHLMTKEGCYRRDTYFRNADRLGWSHRDLFSGNCTAVTDELLKILSPFPEIPLYDGWINLFADALKTRRMIAVPLQAYRRHAENVTSTILTKERPSRLLTFLRSGMGDQRGGWKAYIDLLEQILTRAIERRVALQRVLPEPHLSAALSDLESELSCRKRRLQLMEIPRAYRLPAIAAAWRSGVYLAFGGLRSAFIDLVRR